MFWNIVVQKSYRFQHVRSFYEISMVHLVLALSSIINLRIDSNVMFDKDQLTQKVGFGKRAFYCQSV